MLSMNAQHQSFKKMAPSWRLVLSINASALMLSASSQLLKCSLTNFWMMLEKEKFSEKPIRSVHVGLRGVAISDRLADFNKSGSWS
jgi:hypothetical protein